MYKFNVQNLNGINSINIYWASLIFIINFGESDSHLGVCSIKTTLKRSLQFILTDNPLS